jgi:tRNA uridine 5-carbamoylmethylation protein Kti12
VQTRLVIITGSAPGAGKSTLMRTLAAGLRDLGNSVIEVGEDAVWGERQLGTLPVDYATAWPEFRALNSLFIQPL